ncbi:MAG: hypothetical protein GY845_03250 [Planctomycetes bacterium]|nr:hypothetical protein [Planctomycetota bacterium]
MTDNQKEPNLDARQTEIQDTINKLIKLCSSEPYVSIICSVSIPSNDPDNDEVTVASIYNGDTISQVNQLIYLVEREEQFANDLQVFLSHKIEDRMKTHKTSGNDLADQLLAQLQENNKNETMK